MRERTIFFIRHGESMGNLEGPIYSSRSDIPLSDNGLAQAESLADKFAPKPDLMIVSPYLRAAQTARPLISKFPDVPVEIWSSVHEFEPFSEAQHHGTTIADRTLLYYGYVAMDDCSHSNGDDAESFDMLMERVDETLARLRVLDLENIVVVSHFWFMNALLLRLANPDMRITPKYFADHMLDIKNTEVIKVVL